jgi:sec-independent protein translocase protein TatB
MFEIAWSEMFVIVLVALVVIGPKELPRLIREVGRWTAKARAMGREFQRSFDDMIRDAELEDIRKGLDATRPANIAQTIRDAVDPERDLDDAFSLEADDHRAARTIAAPAPPATVPAPAPTPATVPAPAAAMPATVPAPVAMPATMPAAAQGGAPAGAAQPGPAAPLPPPRETVASALEPR